MRPVVACTVITLSRLAHARVLAASFLEHHPDGRLVALLLDDVDDVAGPSEPFEVIGPSDLGLDATEFLRQAAIYDSLGLAVAMKPHLISYLLAAGESEVLYLDSDVRVFAPLEELIELARRHSLVLVPQGMKAPARFDQNELSSLNTGTFDSGCIAISERARAFVAWWSDRLARHITMDSGFFGPDQRWLSLAPGYFEHTILRDRSYHVAFARLEPRCVTELGGRYLVDGRRLRSVHYGGTFDAQRPWRPHPHVRAEPGSGVAAISYQIAAELMASGYARTVRIPYGFGIASDGEPISDEIRTAYRNALLLHELGGEREPPNPLEGGVGAFISWQRGLRSSRSRTRRDGRSRIVWEGPRGLGGIATANRELCRALGHSDTFDLEVVEIVETNGAASPEDLTDVHVRHSWPPQFDAPEAARWVLMQPWEWGALPREWIQPMNELVDEIWVPSNYVRDCFIQSGVTTTVVVVPYAVDPVRFHPDVARLPLPTGKRFRFLFVGGTVYRKGADILLDTYLTTFDTADDVCLVIKDLGADSIYSGQGLRDRIHEARLDPGAPEILYYDRDDFDKDELASLYRACDCLVHPYRGEGFAMPVAEAMACGLAVIVTGAGACLDYCDSDVAYLLPSRTVEHPPVVFGMETVGPVRLAEPDRDALADAMRRVLSSPERARELGRRASQRVRTQCSWERAAEVAAHRLSSLAARRRTLSVCMIVRDEEALLPRALESVRSVADQVVVVDTGSTDATIELADSFGAEVHRARCTDDFAAARNQSLRHANGDWILVIDGDEELDVRCHEELRQLIAGCAPRGYLLRQLNYQERDGIEDFYEHLALRLFRNHPAARWVGAVYEQLVFDRPGARFEIWPCGVILHHHGGRPQSVDPVTLERDGAALQAAVRAQPGEPFHALNLGNTYRALGWLERAEVEFLRAIALCGTSPDGGAYPHFITSAYLALAQLRLEEGLAADALAFCDKALALRPDFSDLLHMRGIALSKLGRLTEARESYERALTFGTAAAQSATDRAAGGRRALVGLIDVLLALGLSDQAAARLAEAEAVAPENAAVQAARQLLREHVETYEYFGRS